jgi:glycosyltransferase involved in cell wall biosynthesis
MEISVIIPFYNAERFIDDCVRALLAQSYPAERFEIVMVDNNSTDRSAEIVARYPRVRMLSERKQGAYAARNRGLAAASGRLLVFTDPDCVARHDWLERLARAMDDPAAMVVMGRDRPVGPSRGVRLLGAYDDAKERLVMASDDPRVYYGHTNNMITRASLFERFGPFEERLRGSDVIFVQRVLEAFGCDAVRYLPEAQVDHLEIERVADYYRKSFLYGQSGHAYGQVVSARPLTTEERLRAFRSAVRDTGMRPVESGYLFLLLGAGVAYWHVGRVAAAARSRGASAQTVARSGA